MSLARILSYDYLFCAEEAGLGVCEGTRSAPGGKPLQAPYGSGYDDIEYIRVDMQREIGGLRPVAPCDILDS